MINRYNWATDPRFTDDDAYFPGIGFFKDPLHNKIAAAISGMILVTGAAIDTYKTEIWDHINPPTTKVTYITQPQLTCTGNAWKEDFRCESIETQKAVEIPTRTYSTLSELVSSWL